jgi:alkylated DNA repair dioxygenase AlkB
MRRRAAVWLGKPAEALSQMLVAEYRPGTPMGWPRDVPDFEDIVGVSLAGEAKLAFRRHQRPMN